MGLRQFHIVFIALSILCTLGFGIWALLTSADLGPWQQPTAIASTITGICLIIYGYFFLKKPNTYPE